MSVPPHQSLPSLVIPQLAPAPDDQAGAQPTRPPLLLNSPLPDRSQNMTPLTASPATSERSLHYQGKIAGLEGWNDAPIGPFVRKTTPSQLADHDVDPAFLTNKLSEILAECRKTSQPKVFTDTERRLGDLFVKLKSGEDGLPSTILVKMTQLTKALSNKDFDAAQAAQIDLMTGHFEDTRVWIVGIKRLIEMYQKV